MDIGAHSQHGGDEPVQRLTVTGDFSLERQLVARDQNGDPMIAQTAIQD